MGESDSERDSGPAGAEDADVSVVLADLARIRSLATSGEESLRELIETGRHR